MEKQEHGQVALVTGASQGLGRAFAVALAMSGAAVAVTARSRDGIDETARQIAQAGGTALTFPMDVTGASAVERVVAEVNGTLGPISLLVNNAGVMSPVGMDWEVDPDAWWRTFEVNVRGAYTCARAVLPAMVERREGRIINLSSNGGVTNTHAATAYNASKAALTNWTGSLARAVKPHGISVFAYAPGFVHTPLADALVNDPQTPRWYGSAFADRLRNGQDTPLENAVARFLFLASGRADQLTGRHIDVADSEETLLANIDDILRRDLYTLRRRM